MRIDRSLIGVRTVAELRAFELRLVDHARRRLIDERRARVVGADRRRDDEPTVGTRAGHARQHRRRSIEPRRAGHAKLGERKLRRLVVQLAGARHHRETNSANAAAVDVVQRVGGRAERNAHERPPPRARLAPRRRRESSRCTCRRIACTSPDRSGRRRSAARARSRAAASLKFSVLSRSMSSSSRCALPIVQFVRGSPSALRAPVAPRQIANVRLSPNVGTVDHDSVSTTSPGQAGVVHLEVERLGERIALGVERVEALTLAPREQAVDGAVRVVNDRQRVRRERERVLRDVAKVEDERRDSSAVR